MFLATSGDSRWTNAAISETPPTSAISACSLLILRRRFERFNRQALEQVFAFTDLPRSGVPHSEQVRASGIPITSDQSGSGNDRVRCERDRGTRVGVLHAADGGSLSGRGLRTGTGVLDVLLQGVGHFRGKRI